MIYNCDKCGEINLGKIRNAKYCPICGNEVKLIDMSKKVVSRYTELLNEGKKNCEEIMNEISKELHMSIRSVNQAVTKAALNEEIEKDGLVQEQYEHDIDAIVKDGWDGKLKTIKEKLPDDCTYLTICYYARKTRVQSAIERNAKRAEIDERIRSLVKVGTPVEQIIAETGAREYQIEKILVEEIAKDKAIANPYINSENKSKVLEIANSADWDGRLKTIKEALPDVSYLEINAIIAKNK